MRLCSIYMSCILDCTFLRMNGNGITIRAFPLGTHQDVGIHYSHQSFPAFKGIMWIHASSRSVLVVVGFCCCFCEMCVQLLFTRFR